MHVRYYTKCQKKNKHFVPSYTSLRGHKNAYKKCSILKFETFYGGNDILMTGRRDQDYIIHCNTLQRVPPCLLPLSHSITPFECSSPPLILMYRSSKSPFQISPFLHFYFLLWHLIYLLYFPGPIFLILYNYLSFFFHYGQLQ